MSIEAAGQGRRIACMFGAIFVFFAFIGKSSLMDNIAG